MPERTRPRRKTPVDHDPDALVWARKAAGWRQSDLARELQISKSLLCEAEKGTRGLAPGVLIRVAEVLKCPVTVLQRAGTQR